MNELNLFVAFIAGVLSFFAPCVLPVIPGFLAYLSGSSLQGEEVRRGQIFLHAFLFVLGFSLVFAALGILLNTVLESIAYDVQIWLARVGGVLIIFFGLYLTGLFKIGFLEREHKFHVKKKFGSRHLTSVLFGAAFAAGWTPCVGAALGAILGLAATVPGQAFWLLLVYALGLGIPFLVVGLFAAQANKFFSRYARAFAITNKIFGLVLIGLGILIFTQNLARIANFELLNRWLLN